MLQEQQKGLPTQQAQLAAMRTQIPTNPALPSLVRDLTAAAKKAGVSIDSMTPAPPVALVEAPATTVAPTTSGDETASSGSTAAKKPLTHDAAPTSALFKVPLGLSVTGSYFELEQFVSQIERLRRSFLVTGFALTEAATSDAAPGDLTVVIDGRVFLSQPTTATTTTPVVAPATTTGE